MIQTKKLVQETFLDAVEERENPDEIRRYLKKEMAQTTRHSNVPFNQWQVSNHPGAQRPYPEMNLAEKRAFWEIVAKVHLRFKRKLLAGGVQAAFVKNNGMSPTIYDGQARHVGLCALYRELIDPAYQVPYLDDYLAFLKARGIPNVFNRTREEVA